MNRAVAAQLLLAVIGATPVESTPAAALRGSQDAADVADAEEATTAATFTTAPLPTFSNAALDEGSDAPVHTFYMYRAVSDKVYPPENVNTGSLAGVMWYLHNEVVSQTPRKFGISRIVRYKVQTRATQPLYDKGMNFGARLAFDAGQCTGPFECARNGSSFELCTGPAGRFDVPGFSSQAASREWGEYGYFVGCNNLGDFPFPTYPVQYPGAVWYSLPGPCNSRIWSEHDEDCEANQPGGHCSGTPTGQGNCTWSYEDAGEIRLDDLVGIDDYAEFLLSGRREYDAGPDRGFGFTWWDSIHDELANLWRLRKAKQLFALHYPDSVAEDAPPCDFNYTYFYDDPGYVFQECHTAVEGEKCHSAVTWAMQTGIHLYPTWYPGLTNSSSFDEFQDLFYRTMTEECHRPPCTP